MLTKIYKPGQGKYTRLGSGFAAAAIVVVGCVSLYRLLSDGDRSLWITTMVPVVIAVGLIAVVYWLMNKPVVADFMIAAEGELKKVNWSSRKEVAVSTIIVIVVVFAMAILLGVTDVVFQFVFRQLIG
ncbi:MAG TPA: preprotein translocase subunit SecE [Sedimentisphaerales bacterium]|nr:preprotein translocase subunit SecE [Phycisphaerae bacterium]HON91427.1 preprotein translocase subunit SecE [Sedimentisphaerales bacterium]HQI26931.1 preprotein translocase subunit SecE [Sedimentisphaerales bacterium]